MPDAATGTPRGRRAPRRARPRRGRPAGRAGGAASASAPPAPRAARRRRRRAATIVAPVSAPSRPPKYVENVRTPRPSSATTLRIVWETIVPRTRGSGPAPDPVGSTLRATTIARAGSPTRAGIVAERRTPIDVARSTGGSAIRRAREGRREHRPPRDARVAMARHISESATRTSVGFTATTSSTIRRAPMRWTPTTAPTVVARRAAAASRRAPRRRATGPRPIMVFAPPAGRPDEGGRHGSRRRSCLHDRRAIAGSASPRSGSRQAADRPAPWRRAARPRPPSAAAQVAFTAARHPAPP